jgi:hypothetical protein
MFTGGNAIDQNHHTNMIQRNNGFLIATIIGLGIGQMVAQSTIDIAENTIKVGGLSEEAFFFGLAQGDKLVFNLEEVNGKELKEIEIVEWPATSRFMDYKTKKVSNKTIDIPRTAIYKFRLANGAIGGRICRIKIQRIPASPESQNFNTTVYWKNKADTTYTPTEEQYLERSDTIISTPLDQIAKVSSQSALNGNANHTIVDFSLPENTKAWSYYIGVGREGQAEYEKSKNDFMNTAAAKASKIPGYGTLAALAIYGINTFAKVQGSNNVKYWFIADWDNVLLFKAGQSFMQYKQGDVVNEAAQMKAPLEGKVYIALLNDNVMEPIEVVVRVSAVQIIQKWATRTINRMSIITYQEPYLMGK